MVPVTPPPPWINWKALWQIVVYGLVAGAGLPALFAIGLRSLALGGGGQVQTAGADVDGDTGTAPSGRIFGGNPLGLVIAIVCFLVVLAAIGWSVYEIYQSGHPAPAPK
jgi:hypothetical protein